MNNIAEFFRIPVGVELTVLVMLWPAIWAGMLITFALMRDIMRRDKGRTHGLEPDAATHSRMRKAS